MATATSFSTSEHSWRRNSIESVLSIQGKETVFGVQATKILPIYEKISHDVVRDTTDTDTVWASDDDADVLEYEPVSEPEDDLPPIQHDSSGESDEEIIKTRVLEVRVLDDGEVQFADSEQTDSGSETDSEMDFNDYWRCAQCRAANNNPLYRYCEKCFKVRKNFFPPRPKRKSTFKPKTRKEPEIKTVQTLVQQLSQHTDSGVELAFTSQELCQSEPVTEEATTSVNSLLSNSSNRKRRAESTERSYKRSKSSKSCSDSDSDETDIERGRRLRKFRSLDKEVAPLLKTMSGNSVTVDDLVSTSGDNMCIVCLNEPKSGVFVHGRIAHICCCYKCAVKVWAKSKRCPVCNCKVSNVLKAVVM